MRIHSPRRFALLTRCVASTKSSAITSVQRRATGIRWQVIRPKARCTRFKVQGSRFCRTWKRGVPVSVNATEQSEPALGRGSKGIAGRDICPHWVRLGLSARFRFGRASSVNTTRHNTPNPSVERTRHGMARRASFHSGPACHAASCRSPPTVGNGSV